MTGWDVVRWAGTETAITAVSALAFAALLVLVLVWIRGRDRPTSLVVNLTFGHLVGASSVLTLYVPVAYFRPLLYESTAVRLVPSILVAFVLAGFAGRIVSRYPTTDELRSNGRFVATNGWLAATWFVGGVIVAEELFNIRGLGYHWITAIRYNDGPVLFATTMALALPLIAFGVVREVLCELDAVHDRPDDRRRRARERGGRDSSRGSKETAATAGRVAVESSGPAIAAIRSSPRAIVGLVLLVVIVVGSLATVVWPPEYRLIEGGASGWSGLVGVIKYALAAMAETMSASLLAVLVGASTGTTIAAIGRRYRAFDRTGPILGAAVLNLPLILVTVLVTSSTGIALIVATQAPDPVRPVLEYFTQSHVVAGAVAGSALSPLVARDIQRSITGHDRIEHTALSAAAVAVSSGAVTAFVAGALTIFVFNSTLSGLYYAIEIQTGYQFVLVPLIGVGLPAMTLFVLGEGLRDIEERTIVDRELSNRQSKRDDS